MNEVSAPSKRHRPADPVVVCGVLMVALSLAFLAWALYPSWFYADDYHVMLQALGRPVTWEYLLEPFNSHVMPFGKLVIWAVTNQDPLGWKLAATTTLVLQAVASLSCLWMLVTVFGRRWAVLPLLAVYLTSALTLPAMMWWVAALNQVPFQAAFFVCVGLWVLFLRRRQARWAVLTVVVLLLSYACYVKTPLIAGVLVALTMGWFVHPRRVLRPWTWGAGILAPVAVVSATVAAFAAYYLLFVPAPFGEPADVRLGQVADSLLGTSMSTGLLGGPWRWWNTTPPTVLAAPANWAVHASWVVIAFTVAASLLNRRRSLKAWGLAGGYALVLLALLATSRGTIYGALAGLDFRYLTDIVCVVVVCAGLAFLHVPGAPGASERRVPPLLRVELPPVAAAGGLLAVVAGGVWSSVAYVHHWHHDNASRPYLETLGASLRADPGVVDLVPQLLPETVMPPYTTPANQTSEVTRFFPGEAAFPRSTERLALVGDSGELRVAEVDPAALGLPGPREGCGWLVRGGSAEVPLDGPVDGTGSWVRIGYLASQDSPVRVAAGATTVESEVLEGLNDLYVLLGAGPVTSISVSGLSPGTTVCIGSLAVGRPVAGEPLT